MDRNLAHIIGKSFFYASIQTAIISMEVGSKFTIPRFVKTQESMDLINESLRNSLITGLIWMTATVFVMYGSYGVRGGIIGAMMNLIIITWLYYGYRKYIHMAAKEHGLNCDI